MIKMARVSVTVQDLVKRLMIDEACLDGVVTRDRFHEISRHLSQWKLLSPKLNILKHEVEDIEGDDRSPEVKKVSFLGKWKEKSIEATYRTLVESLLSIDRVEDAKSLCRGKTIILGGQIA